MVHLHEKVDQYRLRQKKVAAVSRNLDHRFRKKHYEKKRAQTEITANCWLRKNRKEARLPSLFLGIFRDF